MDKDLTKLDIMLENTIQTLSLHSSVQFSKICLWNRVERVWAATLHRGVAVGVSTCRSGDTTSRCDAFLLKMWPWLLAFVKIAPDCLKKFWFAWERFAESSSKKSVIFLGNFLSAPVLGEPHTVVSWGEGRNSFPLYNCCMVGTLQRLIFFVADSIVVKALSLPLLFMRCLTTTSQQGFCNLRKHWEYPSLCVCFFSQMRKLNYLIRKVYTRWANSHSRKIMIYKLQQLCIFYMSVIIVSKSNLFVCCLTIFIIACRSVVHRMTSVFAFQVFHVTNSQDKPCNEYGWYNANVQLYFYPKLADTSQLVFALVPVWRYN